ncbi:MerR family transcriptional regulator [Paenibacillus sp. FSL W7-1279]|uniref:MerR family transcriptional regulator n=1 Tax=Paenibacillus TaxID=44249 RepID=UPI00188D3CA3|nr:MULTISPECIES: MerR family transcriptional regulator [Paenibacillus]MBX4150685.1 MerR family transcriptional regulator [Paenibacillus lautus]
MLDQMMTIGQLSNHTGESVRTLRYYDKIGLLTPSDYKDGGHRLYSRDDLVRLQQIQALKFIGFSLKDIANILQYAHIEQEQIKSTIQFKRKQLTAELERIQDMIDQLNHMDMIISNENSVDIRSFCFIMHSILWEEENLDENKRNLYKIYNFRDPERFKLDQEYYSLFSRIRHLVMSKTSPESEEALECMRRLMFLHKQTLIKMAKLQEDAPEAETFNILDPFTDEEKVFIKDAMRMMSESE